MLDSPAKLHVRVFEYITMNVLYPVLHELVVDLLHRAKIRGVSRRDNLLGAYRFSLT